MIVVVPVDPPREGLVLTSLVEETPLTEREGARLYAAATTDVLRTAATSGGDVLVNYRDAETLPADHGGEEPELEVRELAAEALGDLDDVRFERQVGSDRSARVGNTVTYLLEREDAASVGVLEPTAPLAARTEIDGAAMSLRRHDAVLGPTSGGDVYFAGFAETIDFADAHEPPALSTLANRAAASGVDVGFAPTIPSIETADGLASTVAGVKARAAVDRLRATETAGVVADLDLRVGPGGEISR